MQYIRKERHPEITQCPNGHVLIWKSFEFRCFRCNNKMYFFLFTIISPGNEAFECTKCGNRSCVKCSEFSCCGYTGWRITDSPAKCHLCNENIKAGFSCVCGFTTCSKAFPKSFYSLRTCPSGHELHFKANIKALMCLKCEKVPDKVLSCACDYSLCLKCKEIAFVANKCINGHNIHWKNFPKPQFCLKCQQYKPHGLACTRDNFAICTDCHMKLPKLKADANQNRNVVEEEKREKCKGCYLKEANVVLTPCMHLGLCEQCAESVQRCPFCRSLVREMHRVYIQ